MEQEKILPPERPEIEEISQELKDLRSLAYRQNYDKVVKFGKILKKRYPDCYNYALFHFLVCSTPKEEALKHFDFPGTDSVRTFLESFRGEKE